MGRLLLGEDTELAQFRGGRGAGIRLDFLWGAGGFSLVFSFNAIHTSISLSVVGFSHGITYIVHCAIMYVTVHVYTFLPDTAITDLEKIRKCKLCGMCNYSHHVTAYRILVFWVGQLFHCDTFC